MIGVNFVISATTTGLQKAVAGAKNSFASMRKSVNGAAASLSGFLGVGLGAAGLSKLAGDALLLAKNLQNTSEKLGVTTTLLQELGFAGDQVGVSQDTVNMALQRFTRRLGEAQQGTGELLKPLQQYGIALRDSNGQARSATDILKDYADVVSNAATDQEQLRLAFKAFDSEGAALVSILKDGKAGLEAFGVQAREAGAIMEESTVESLAKAEQAISDFKKRITVAVGEIIVNFKSEEGLKLLGLQLLRAAASFGGGVLDALYEAAQIGGAVLAGLAENFAMKLKNFGISALSGIAAEFNKVLPSRFEINIGNLTEFVDEGEAVGDTIARAIAQTSPAKFKQDFTGFWDDAIAKQKGVLAEQTAVQETTTRAITQTFEKAADEVKDAGKDAGTSIKEGGQQAAQEIEKASKKMAMVFGRGSEAIQDATDGALKELIRREKQLIEGFRTDPTMESLARALSTAQSQGTITKAEQELAFRQGIRRNISAFGVEGARRFSSVDPLAFDKVVSEIVTGRDVNEKALDELKTQTRLLRGKFKAQ